MFEELEPKFDFEFNSSQQVATVVFDIYPNISNVTILQDESLQRFNSDAEYEKYNPSSERSSTCVYVKEENCKENVIKICTIQHKGKTNIQIFRVTEDELKAFGIKIKSFTLPA